ncbi:MAG: hypothetical protein GX878_00990, partial [Firmicutes bacterium]|nr:hypothetical protein [Bacillota bacterium]
SVQPGQSIDLVISSGPGEQNVWQDSGDGDGAADEGITDAGEAIDEESGD